MIIMIHSLAYNEDNHLHHNLHHNHYQYYEEAAPSKHCLTNCAATVTPSRVTQWTITPTVSPTEQSTVSSFQHHSIYNHSHCLTNCPLPVHRCLLSLPYKLCTPHLSWHTWVDCVHSLRRNESLLGNLGKQWFIPSHKINTIISTTFSTQTSSEMRRPKVSLVRIGLLEPSIHSSANPAVFWSISSLSIPMIL